MAYIQKAGKGPIFPIGRIRHDKYGKRGWHVYE